jgi:hypothetical protein
LKREVKLLRQKALDSLPLSIVHRTSLALFDRGCVHSVLIFLDHAFEMLLKAAILHKGGKIRKRRAKQTIGFNACITGSANSQIRFLKNEQAVLFRPSAHCVTRRSIILGKPNKSVPASP